MATRVGVEWRFAHQAMDAGLGAQEAVGVFAIHLDGAALDAGDFAFGLLEQFDLEVAALAVAQVHALEHARPVLGLGAAGAGLDLDEAGVGVHRVGEHAAKFELADLLFECREVGLDRHHGVLVVLHLRQLEQLLEIVGHAVGVLQRHHYGFERLFLLAQLLGAGGVIPHRRIFQRADYFFEFGLLFRVVKDTSGVRARDA